MEDFFLNKQLNKLDIYSDKETYDLFFNVELNELLEVIQKSKVIVIDKVVLELYENELNIDSNKIITIEAKEEEKGPQQSLDICEQLMLKDIRRKDTIVAIGGGITQDLVTFASSILFRGIKWIFIPTTLLAQADSCIGGKSCLNFKTWKNILGNFYPPHQVYVYENFLKTLHSDDIRSGIGEILKVHLLSGKESSDDVLLQMNELKSKPSILSDMIFNSLKLKNRILKVDALDTGFRLKMNYGHSFGHALESASNYNIPHGIAVTIGLDMANYIAYLKGYLTEKYFLKVHDALRKNLESKDFVSIDFKVFINALKKDKKNDAEFFKLVIPKDEGEVELMPFKMNDETEELIKQYFDLYYQ